MRLAEIKNRLARRAAVRDLPSRRHPRNNRDEQRVRSLGFIDRRMQRSEIAQTPADSYYDSVNMSGSHPYSSIAGISSRQI